MEKENRIHWLDPLRGSACLLVVIAHIISVHTEYGIYASGCGKIGVWMFFILSSFLLTLPYSQGKKFDGHDVFSFYIKRVVRVMPCYIVILCVSYGIGYIQSGTAFVNHIFMIEGTGHFWTVPVEMKFYLIAPLVLLCITMIKNKNFQIGMISLLIIIFTIYFPYTSYIENSISLYWYLPVFLMGILTSILYVKYKDKFNDKYIFDIFVIMILLTVLLSMPYFRFLTLDIQPDRYLQNKYLFFGIAWSILILSIAHGRYIKRILEKSKILSWIGKISFPLYLIHYIVLLYANQYFENYKLMFVFVIVISIVLASVCYYLIEKPCISYMKRVLSKTINVKLKVFVIAGIILILLVSTSVYFGKQREEHNKWRNRLYVPTMIEKIDNQYFIVDCWNHRVLYNDSLDKDIENWNTLTDENYKGGHIIASDGELYSESSIII